MSDADLITAVFHRTKDGYLAAQVEDLAWLAVPVDDGLRIASAWRLEKAAETWTPAVFHSADGLVPDEAGFRAHVEAVAGHRRQLRMLVRAEQRMRISTPWGRPQQSMVYAEGVVCHSTASHGGFRLDRARNALVHPALRNRGGWYEEDCEWAKVAATFPVLFTDRERATANQTLRHWYPDAWEQIHSVVLRPGESHVKDERRFRLEHARDWVVISAIRSCDHPGMVECHATRGGDRGAADCRHFLVPKREYAAGCFGFVIDEDAIRRCDLPDDPLNGLRGSHRQVPTSP